ncbi:Chemotaxis response regulator protein-glutamate methylesterase [Cesiribacter andamanensis AMV16]|uniref:protein-glutamate methylesterase n=1 Tax=Cesiribacter andamanensis AMV16 TaxID=1279009 RepID=M7NTM2_9BACT|nr:Chemotaxis response regulator protein-glutamate methylesterase [Cesiribacter andamanensis AMV16]
MLHRLRNNDSDLQSVYARKLALQVQEIEEKETLAPGNVYIAPPNYHVLLEKDLSFSLDSSELENFSRPSIDVTFASAARVLGKGVAGILLSGANSDGSKGLKAIAEKGGLAIVQDPAEAEVATMPAAGLRLTPACRVFTLQKIQDFLTSLL